MKNIIKKHLHELLNKNKTDEFESRDKKQFVKSSSLSNKESLFNSRTFKKSVPTLLPLSFKQDLKYVLGDKTTSLKKINPHKTSKAYKESELVNLDSLSPFSLDFSSVSNEIPEPLFSLWLDLCRRGVHATNIFRAHGCNKDVERLKCILLSCESQPIDSTNFDILSVGTIFKRYFRLLPESLISPKQFELWRRANEAEENLSKNKLFAKAIKKLPPEHYQMLRYLLCLLQKISLQKDKNLMSSRSLAICIGPSLYSSPCTSKLKTMIDCIEYLIENCELLLEDSPHCLYKKYFPKKNYDQHSDFSSTGSHFSFDLTKSPESPGNQVSPTKRIKSSSSIHSSLSRSSSKICYSSQSRQNSGQPADFKSIYQRGVKLRKSQSFLFCQKKFILIPEIKRNLFESQFLTKDGYPLLLKSCGSSSYLPTTENQTSADLFNPRLKRRISSTSNKSSGSDHTIKDVAVEKFPQIADL